MAWEPPPEIRPSDLPAIHDAHTYDVIKRMTDQMEADLEAEFPGEQLPGFVMRLLTSLRWRLREWENKQP